MGLYRFNNPLTIKCQMRLKLKMLTQKIENESLILLRSLKFFTFHLQHIT